MASDTEPTRDQGRTDRRAGEHDAGTGDAHFPRAPDLPAAPTYADPTFARRLAAALGDANFVAEADAPLPPTQPGPEIRLNLVVDKAREEESDQSPSG